jgi:LacI family transcriptional regulator
MSKPTLSAIALKAGVAKSTVSLALRNSTRVSEKQRKHIQEVAEEMGYQHNALLARLMAELRKSQSGNYVATLAAISMNPKPYETKNAVAQLIIEGYTRKAEKLGYGVDHFNYYNAMAKPKQNAERLCEILKARNIQGVIFYKFRENDALIECKPIWENFACVVLGPRIDTPPLNFVTIDHFYTAKLACEKTIAAGYQRVGIVLDAWIDDIMEHRLVASYNLIRDKHKKWPPVLTLNLTKDYKESTNDRQAFEAWMNKYKPDVCLCINNNIPKWLNEMGYRFPEDIGVVMLDLNEENKAIGTGVNQRISCVGEKAADLIVAQINRNEIGVPAFQTGSLIPGVWVDGPSIQSR